MKFVLLALALVGVASAGFVPHKQHRSLLTAIDQIKNEIPYQEIIDISLGCVGDPALHDLVVFMGSNVAQDAVDVFVKNDDVVEFVFWLEAHGVDAVAMLNRIFALLGLRPIETFNGRGECGGWQGLHDKIMAVVDIDSIGALIKKLWAEDAEFGEMMNMLQGAQSILQGLIETPAVRLFLDGLKEHGVDTIAIRDVIRKLFGWSL